MYLDAGFEATKMPRSRVWSSLPPAKALAISNRLVGKSFVLNRATLYYFGMLHAYGNIIPIKYR